MLGNECIQDECPAGLTLDKLGKCTIPRCDALRDNLRVKPRNAYHNIEDILKGYNIFTGSPFSQRDVGFAEESHSVYDWSKLTTQGEWTAPEELEVELLSTCDEDTDARTVVDAKSLQEFYFEEVKIGSKLKVTDQEYEFKPAFTGSRDFKRWKSYL